MNPNTPNTTAVVYTSPIAQLEKPYVSNSRMVIAGLVSSGGLLIAGAFSTAALYFAGIADRALGYSESGLMRDAAIQSLLSSLGIFAVGALMSVCIGWLTWQVLARVLLSSPDIKPYYFSCLAALLVPAIIIPTYSVYILSLFIVWVLVVTFGVLVLGSWLIGLLIFRNTKVNPRNRNIIFMAAAAVMSQIFFGQGFYIYVNHLSEVESEFKNQQTFESERESSQTALRRDAEARELFTQQVDYIKESGIPQLQPRFVSPDHELSTIEITADEYSLIYEEAHTDGAKGSEQYKFEVIFNTASEFKVMSECTQYGCDEVGALGDGTPIYYDYGYKNDIKRLFIIKDTVIIAVPAEISNTKVNRNPSDPDRYYLTTTSDALNAQKRVNIDSLSYKVINSIAESPLVYINQY